MPKIKKTIDQAIYKAVDRTPVLHISETGNSKIGRGIASFSTLPGDAAHMLYTKDGRLVTDEPGTCSENCDTCFKRCYAVNSAHRYHNTCIPAWLDNTLLLRRGKLFKALDDYLTKKNAKKKVPITTFRINVSGEIQTPEEFREWNALAKKHPETMFAVYTKNYDALEIFLKEVGGESEPNFVINVSQWHGVADEFIRRNPTGYNIFEYDDSNKKSCELSEADKARLAKECHCPAVTREGKHAKTPAGEPITCDHCKRCYTKTGKVTAVWSH